MCATCHVTSPVKYAVYFYISTFRNTCAVPNMAVFCSSLISCFFSALFRYCLGDFEMVPVVTVITGITSAFAIHLRWISIRRSLYFTIRILSFFLDHISVLQHPLTCVFLFPFFCFSPFFFSFFHCYYHRGAIPPFSHTPSSWWSDNFPALLCAVIIVTH